MASLLSNNHNLVLAREGCASVPYSDDFENAADKSQDGACWSARSEEKEVQNTKSSEMAGQVMPLLALQAALKSAGPTRRSNLERPGGTLFRRNLSRLDQIPNALAWAIAFALVLRGVEGSSTAGNGDEEHSLHKLLWTDATLILNYWVDLPAVPSIIAEWAALVPLTVYLSNARSDFELAGEVSLRGRLSVGVVPKLWALGGIAKLLQQGEVFLDSASSAGEPMKVYDVQWGTIFPCYNSAAARAVVASALEGREYTPAITMEDCARYIVKNGERLQKQFPDSENLDSLVQKKILYGRRQLLNIVVISETIEGSTRREGVEGNRVKLTQSTTFHALELLATLAISGVVVAIGCIGSGALLAVGAVSRFLARHCGIKRSGLYLRNREAHEGVMLASEHDNATVWTLYLGHRGLIDSLLNKPMISFAKANPLALHFFQFAEVVQVIAMTYIAGQKGWDGILHLLCVVVVWTFGQFYGYNQHAKNWLRSEGFKTTAFGVEFPARTEMLGAVELLSDKGATIWMDPIIPPAVRRTVYLDKIGVAEQTVSSGSSTRGTEASYDQLNERDQWWVNATAIQTIAGYELIKEELRKRCGTDKLNELAVEKRKAETRA